MQQTTYPSFFPSFLFYFFLFSSSLIDSDQFIFCDSPFALNSAGSMNELIEMRIQTALANVCIFLSSFNPSFLSSFVFFYFAL